ncbi:MAG: S9 family peptidase [Candidatus Dormiibacterota bacterium]
MTNDDDPLRPPAPAQKPVVHRAHGDDRIDEYVWLRDREDPAVIAHLTAENAWTERSLAHLGALRERIYSEIVGRVQETDDGAPVPYGPYEYYSRTVEGRQYPIHCRRERDGGDEQVVLDENALAEGYGFFHLGDAEVSPNHALFAYTFDVSGGELYTLRIADLSAGVDLPAVIEGVSYSIAWSRDATHLFYTRPDAAMRPWQVWRHRVGDAAGADALVHEETDERFYTSVASTRSGAYIAISLNSRVTSEVHLLHADHPTGSFTVVEPRRQGIEYSVDHHGDTLYIVTNDEAVNFRLMTAPVATPSRDHWVEIVPHREDVTLERVDLFARHAVLFERAHGLREITVMRLRDGHRHTVIQPETVYAASPGPNLEWDTDTLRFTYASLVTPTSAIDYGMDSRERTIVKMEPVLGGYDPSKYVTGRLWARADDGTEVPISYVHRRDVALDGSAPALLYGYGSYEYCIDPGFDSERLSLLDRGFVYAIAHIRGGGELGRRWYEDGKLLHKRNTFSDFCACADHLVAERFTSHEHLAIRGASAGGLLMGAVVNMRPDLAAAVVAEVPFVDCLTTMFDASLPLTVGEFEEWGNPEDAATYAYMRGYSPYDNVIPSARPAMLVTAGLNDQRVGYWEPAKWVARLRERGEEDAIVLLKTEMGAGHGGVSGRYDAWRDEALALAFVIDVVAPGSE